ncbi:MAG: tRNA uridine(34) 5-carboxymethylaminomethyl modification radical SAM/GNAT enzyme Elp3 [Candidatus Bathyarchaeia archaeon]
MDIGLELDRQAACRMIIKGLLAGGGLGLHRLKVSAARLYRLNTLPTNVEILSYATEDERRQLLHLLQLKPVRSISGVSVIAVMTPPRPCPHGRCAYCPNVPGVPNSYTGREPSAMRGLQNAYDPYRQVKSRLNQLKAIGHPISKVELIVQGGTFPAVGVDEQRAFMKGCLDAITGKRSDSFEEAVYLAEGSRVRTVGVTFETRPDCCGEKEIETMLSLGVTRVELGVQTLNDAVYQLVDRGHTVRDVVEATQRLKDAGLKVCYHMMPGLPGSNFKQDLDTFERLFSEADYKPDMLKIYPCLVLKGTKLYDWWRQGLYRPYKTDEAVELLLEVKSRTPPWVRIMRVQRDIPAPLIIAGVKKSNLRQLVRDRMAERGLRCRCIRCREVGHRLLVDKVEPEQQELKLNTYVYDASGGREFFIAIEEPEKDILVGYLRLRFPSEEASRPEVSDGTAGLVRELHVYGREVPVGEAAGGAWQHRGFGAELLSKAESICAEEGLKKILVTSAIGVRRYFRRFGYEREGPYMKKLLSQA